MQSWKVARSIDGDFLGVYPDTGNKEFPIAIMPSYVKAEINEAHAKQIALLPDLLSAARAFLEPYKELSEPELERAIERGYCIFHFKDRDLWVSRHMAESVRAFRKIIEQVGGK